jgi:hypothetical protein
MENISRPKSDKKIQDVASGTSSMAPPMIDKTSWNDKEDTPMDENDTNTTPLTREGTLDELRHSPIRTKIENREGW